MMREKMGPFEYYETSSAGLHTFLTRATEYLIAKLVVERKAKVHYYAYMTGGTIDEESVDEVIRMMGGSETGIMNEGFPLSGFNSAKDKVSGSKLTISQGPKDGLWEFKKITKHPVYLGVLSMFTQDYGRRPAVMSCPFVASYDMEEAVIMMTCLRESTRKFIRQTYRVVDSTGSRIENFRRMDWNQIFMPGSTIRDLKAEVEGFFKSKEMYEKHGLDWRRGILLVGPPGNGKTSVCRAIATTSQVPIVYCLMSDGDPYSLLQSAHSTIVRNAPCIAIFEDADSFGADESVRSSMLNLFDGLVSSEGVLTIASTNCPDKLDAAITGRPSRFDSLYLFDNPGEKERKMILANRLGKESRRLSKAIGEVADLGANLSAAAIQEIAVCALLDAMKVGKPVSDSNLKDGLAKVKKHMQCAKFGMDKWARGSVGFSTDVQPGEWPTHNHCPL